MHDHIYMSGLNTRGGGKCSWRRRNRGRLERNISHMPTSKGGQMRLRMCSQSTGGKDCGQSVDACLMGGRDQTAESKGIILIERLLTRPKRMRYEAQRRIKFR